MSNQLIRTDPDGSTNVYKGSNTTPEIAGLVLTADMQSAISGVTKTSLGLGNVDNTSDANKPVSTAQAAALLLKATPPVYNRPPQLLNWFKSTVTNKKIVLTGDSTTLDTSQGFLARLQYYGAKIIRPIPTGVTIARSGTTVTMSGGALFFSGDIGGTLYWDSGSSSVITAVTNATTATVADSGTIAAGTGRIERNITYNGNANSPLANVIVYHCGDNGQTAEGHIAGTGVYTLSYVISLAPDLILSSFLINDFRLGATSLATGTARLTTLADAYRGGLPNSCTLFRIPNTFLSTDPGSTGFVSPLGSAQAYSNDIAKAYRAMDGLYPNVMVWDTRKTIWDGDTCKATSGLMTDILHPSYVGQAAVADDLVKLIGTPIEYQKSQSDAAYASAPTTAYTVYPKILEDTRYYSKLLEGAASSSGAFFDIFQTDATQLGSIRVGDIVFIDGQTPFVTTAAGSLLGGSTLRVLMTPPVTWTSNNRVRVYRKVAFSDSTILQYLAQPDTYPFAVPVIVSGAGVGYLDINTVNGGDFRHLEIVSGDILVTIGAAALTLSSATIFPSNGAPDGSAATRVLKSGDYTAKSGINGYIFGSTRNATWIKNQLKSTKTITASGTTGARTINATHGTARFAAGASTLVVTNSLVDTNSNIFPVVYGTDTTATSCRVTKGSGSFTLTLNAAATAETEVGFWVLN